MSTLEQLATTLRGDVLTPGNPEYEKALVVWNYEMRAHPLAIFRVIGASDVIKVIKHLYTPPLPSPPIPLSIRSGGHSMRCLCDGYVIDLTKMRSCRVDPETKTIQVDGGCLLSDVYNEAAAHGLFLPAGTVSHTGTSGLALMGGYGWLCREFGLTIDHMLEVDIVTADGELKVVNKDSHPDLFWGIRGAGSCFGVVTSFKFRLVPSTSVYAGHLFYSLPRFTNLWSDFVKLTSSEETFPRNDFMMFVLTHGPDTQKAVVLMNCFHGTEDAGKTFISPFVAAGPVMQHFEQMSTLKWFCSNDHLGPYGHWYQKAINADKLSIELGAVLLEAFSNSPTTTVSIGIETFGGKVCDVPEDATAFGLRTAKFGVNLMCRWDTEEQGVLVKKWARDVYVKLTPFKSTTTYINYEVSSMDESPKDGKEYFGAHYEKLQKLKAKYDPNTTFRSVAHP